MWKKYCLLAAVAATLLSGCGKIKIEQVQTQTENRPEVKIQLDGDTATASSKTVKIEEGVITLTEEADYLISGTLEDGSIVVDAEDNAQIQLVLNGVSITSTTTAAIYVKAADEVTITLGTDTHNLVQSEAFLDREESKIDGAIFAKSDLTIQGQGALSVTAQEGHGIVCKDDAKIASGNIQIEATGHGMDVNDSVTFAEATLDITAGKDGIHVENTENEEKGYVLVKSGAITISSDGDGISASANMDVEDGEINILAGGGYENGTQKSANAQGNSKAAGWQGQRSEWAEGQTPERTKGERPELPEGQMPEKMQGQRPELPEGQMPEEMQGQRPELPEGQMPEETQGDNSQDIESTSADSSLESEDSTSMKGLKAAGDIRIAKGTITIDSADDSIHSNASITIEGGTFTLSSGDDGIHGDETITVMSGNISILESYEGIEALHVDLMDGEIVIHATDDGINAAGGKDESGLGGRDGMFGKAAMGMQASNGSVVISGGEITIYASGDGIDSNGSLEISDGIICVTGPTEGDTSVLNYDTTGTITGGTFIGTGAMNMAQNFSNYTQGVVFQKVEKAEAGSTILLKDESGNTVLEHTPEEDFELVIISSPELTLQEEYTVEIIKK